MTSASFFKIPLSIRPILEQLLKSLLFFLSISMFASLSALAQSDDLKNLSDKSQQYQIEDFSEDYEAVVTVYENAKDSDRYKEPVINIIDKKTNQIIFSQPTQIDIEYELEASEKHVSGNSINANIISLPYDHFSGLIYEDFNFDNQKDIALKDDNFSCYGGSSYNVYLKDSKTFTFNEAFTKLAHEYCGFFNIDKETQTLDTMTKSGAGWHQYSEFKVINNNPVAIHIIEKDWKLGVLLSITEKTRIDGRMVVDEYQVLPELETNNINSQYIYSSDLDNGKKMVLGDYGDNHLYYAFADETGRVELFYDGQFIYSPSTQTLMFSNNSYKYFINNDGISVKRYSKTTLLESKPSSISGSLQDIMQYKNVIVR